VPELLNGRNRLKGDDKRRVPFTYILGIICQKNNFQVCKLQYSSCILLDLSIFHPSWVSAGYHLPELVQKLTRESGSCHQPMCATKSTWNLQLFLFASFMTFPPQPPQTVR
jgi:hypothetical protein